MDEWDTEITSRGITQKLDRKTLMSHFDLVATLVRRDLVSVYKQTILGPGWLILQPILQALVYSFLLTGIAKISTGDVPPLVFYLTCITFWGYFSRLFTDIADILIVNEEIYSKVFFPRMLNVIALVVTNSVKLIFQLCVLVVVYLFFDYGAKGSVADIIFSSGYLYCICTGLALALGLFKASINVKYRDLRNLSNILIQLYLYATPVLYQLTLIPESVRSYFWFNPLTHGFENLRHVFFDLLEPDKFGLIYSAIVILIFLCFSVMRFNKIVRNYIDTV